MNSITDKTANQCTSGKCSPVIPSPPFAVMRAIPTTMESMIAMIVVMIVVTILIVVEASSDMLPVICIMSIPSGVIGMMVWMMIGMVLLMIEMMLMIYPVLVIV